MTQEARPEPASSREQREMPASQDLRDFGAARSRYAQDELAAAVARGATQCVILGAPFDRFACLNEGSRLRVFEAEQLLGSCLGPKLRNLGFSDSEITFFSWLGAMPHPTVESAIATFAFIGSRPDGSSVVFDYAAERSSLESAWQTALDPLASRFARAGEPPRMFLDPGALHAMLRAAGFRHIEDRRAAGSAHLVTALV